MADFDAALLREVCEAGRVSSTEDAAVALVHAVLSKMGLEPTDRLLSTWKQADADWVLSYKTPDGQSELTVKALRIDDTVLLHVQVGDHAEYPVHELRPASFINDDADFHNADRLFGLGCLETAQAIAVFFRPILDAAQSRREPMRGRPARDEDRPRSESSPDPGVSGTRNQAPPEGNPFSIGSSDLNPPFARPRGDPEAGGMLVGPHHPIFGNPPQPDNSPRPPFHPPGARWDPIHPFGGGVGPMPGRGRGRGSGLPPDQDPRQRIPGEPDFDELMPPGGPGWHDPFL